MAAGFLPHYCQPSAASTLQALAGSPLALRACHKDARTVQHVQEEMHHD